MTFVLNKNESCSHAQLAIVVSQFNADITHLLCEGALNQLQDQGISKENIYIVQVPGAIEIPLVAQNLAKLKKYQAIICLGSVIRGETTHYDYVCQQVSQGCLRVMLDYSIPVIFGILTTENREQALERTGGKEGHKGREAASTAISMIEVINKLEQTKAG